MERAALLVLLCTCTGVLGQSNLIPGSSRGISTGDELVAAVLDACPEDPQPLLCVKLHTLSYLDHLTGSTPRSLEGEKRSLEEGEERLDELVLSRVQRFLRDHQFKVQLPEFFFQEATLTFHPSKGLDFDVSFPPAPQAEERAFTEARDMMQQKMLLPLLLLLKIKLKALTPIMVAMVSMKALKALILSKISILLVLGFLAAQLFKKAGMMPMMPMMTMEPAAPSTAYGAPAPAPAMGYGVPPPTSGYGAPSAPPPPVTMSSYEPSWEPSPGGPYKRNWEPQQVVYSAYSGSPPPAPQASSSR